MVSASLVSLNWGIWSNDAIFSTMPSRKNLWISSNYSLDVVLFLNLIMPQLLKVNKTVQYIKSTTYLYQDCRPWAIPISQGLYNIWLHAKHAQGICCIETFSLPSLWFKQGWWCLIKPRTPRGFTRGPQNGNAGKYFVSHIFFNFMCHIVSVLNMILVLIPLPLDGTFSIFSLIHNTIFTLWVWEVFLVFPWKTYLFFKSGGVNFHRCVRTCSTRNLHHFY